VPAKKALNYLIQSTTSDRVMTRATEIDNLLKERKSFISHIVHDELVLDFHESDRDLLPKIKEVFETDNFKANIMIGSNYLDLKELKL
jgi:DNA polymerase I-like protein with 3'-5' exonuclease and polymerase domains